MKTLITLIGVLVSQLAVAQLPTLGVKNEKPLKIVKMNVDVTVVGNIATTSFDVVFHNPNARVLEGELRMPLAEGQEISRYALDVNGNLREGVVVEKVKARQVYEAVVRQSIDPGVISKTKGNAFKTSIYPIPAKGNKRVVIALTQTLKNDKGLLHYTLPMDAKQKIADFALTVKVLKGEQESGKLQGGFENISFDQQGDAYLLNFARKDYRPKEPLKFNIPLFRKQNYQLFTETRNGNTYFYVNYNPPAFDKTTRKISKDITLYWDRSFSAEERKLEKELNLLKKYLETNKSKTITVVGFNYEPEASKVFKIKDDASSLISYLKTFSNDGATQFENLKFPAKTDEILLFSDGVNTLGTEKLEAIEVPVFAISSAVGANYEWLKGIAAISGGAFINLNVLNEKQALSQLQTKQETLPVCSFDKSKITEFYQGKGQIAGILKANKAELTLRYNSNNASNLIPLSFSLDEKGRATQKIIIEKGANAPVARIWAGLKIERLGMNYKQNKDEITALGKKFGIVTRNTSLLVLDRVEDYVEHKITPPKDLLDAYNKAIQAKNKVKKEVKDDVFADNIKRITALKKWYKTPPKVDKESDVLEPPQLTTFQQRATPVADARAVVEAVEIQEEAAEYMSEDESRLDEVVVAGSASMNKKRESKKTKATVKVLAWLPDAPYLKLLRESDDFEKAYLEQKIENRLRPAFYVEVANLLFQKGEKKKAIRVLSNVLELELENPELLKVAAHKLLQEKEASLAVKIFEEVKELRPEEPQSYRDLAQVYEALGQYQKALDMYMYILNNRWGRFEDVKDIVLNEMNRLISLHKEKVDTTAVPSEYIFEMPLDMRFTIDWTSNENDIDLWVVEPSGEKCYYKHANTQMGGKISKDFTAGYGPEEYTLKDKVRGTFTIYANYFGDRRQRITGPVTVYTRLYTNYGKPDESVQVLTIQLTSKKETIQLGQAYSD